MTNILRIELNLDMGERVEGPEYVADLLSRIGIPATERISYFTVEPLYEYDEVEDLIDDFKLDEAHSALMAVQNIWGESPYKVTLSTRIDRMRILANVPDHELLLSNLMAVVHRDGGHTESEIGTEEAEKLAERTVVDLIRSLEIAEKTLLSYGYIKNQDGSWA